MYKDVLEHLEAARSEKKWSFFSSYARRLTIIDLFWRHAIIRDTFLALASVLGPNKKADYSCVTLSHC